MFERKGLIQIPIEYNEDEVMLSALDAGATDVETLDDSYLITTPSDKFIAVKEALMAIGVEEFLTSEVTYVPTNTIELDDEKTEKVYNLIESLEELDDVQAVYSNLKGD